MPLKSPPDHHINNMIFRFEERERKKKMIFWRGITNKQTILILLVNWNKHLEKLNFKICRKHIDTHTHNTWWWSSPHAIQKRFKKIANNRKTNTEEKILLARFGNTKKRTKNKNCAKKQQNQTSIAMTHK